MKTIKSIIAALLCFSLTNFVLSAQINDLFIDANTGNDRNVGTKEQPLKSLNEAASRVNTANGTGAITIYLSDGIYGLDATVTFHPANWHFSKDQRTKAGQSDHIPPE